MAAKPAISDSIAAPAEVDTSLLESLVGYRLRRASTVFKTDFSAALEGLGMRQVLFGIMAVVHSNPGLIQITLGKVLGIQRANLVPLLNELSERKLVDRRPAPGDRRASALYLTGDGEKLLQDAVARVRAHEDKVLARLTSAERAKLIELLGKIRAE